MDGIGSDNWLLFLLVFCRVAGLFVLSPLFSSTAITTTVKFFLSAFISILLAFVLYPEVMPWLIQAKPSIWQVIWLCTIESFLGYLIGFCFAIVFDAIKLAGELIDTLTGLSAGQIFDPITNTFQSFTGQLLVMFGLVVMLSIDFHHVIIKVVAQSFQLVPIGHFYMHSTVLDGVIEGTAKLFPYAIQLAAIPLILITICLTGIAFTIRMIPEMNLLLIGVPMRILVGLFTLMLAVSHMVPLFRQAFWYYAQLVFRLFA